VSATLYILPYNRSCRQRRSCLKNSIALPVPPSGCPDCTLLKRAGPTITVLDGVDRTATITERKLCLTHLVGDSTVPPPSPLSPTYVPDSPPLPPTLAPESAAPPQVAESVSLVKVRVKRLILDCQAAGDRDHWMDENFQLPTKILSQDISVTTTTALYPTYETMIDFVSG
jgi:hypothetical protein